MSTPLEDKLRTQAASNSTLSGLLGSLPFRWWDSQLTPGSAFPAVVVLLVSAPGMHVLTGRMSSVWSRVQFTIWGASGDSARQVESALMQFLDTFNAIGIPNAPAYPYQVANRRSGMYVQSQPPKYWRILDAIIFNNENL